MARLEWLITRALLVVAFIAVSLTVAASASNATFRYNVTEYDLLVAAPDEITGCSGWW